MALLVSTLLFLKFPLHLKGGSQRQIQVLKKEGGGLALKTGQKSKDKYCFLLSILVV